MTRFVNLTNHRVVNILGDRGEVLSISRERDCKPARIRSHQITLRDHAGIRIKCTVVDGIDDLPDPCTDTIYIVSYLVAVNANRIDVVSPNQFPGEYISDPRTKNTLMVKSLQAFPVKGMI